jgi:aspartate racemase
VEAERIFVPLFDRFNLGITYSLAARLNALQKANDEAYKKYKPRPYKGRTIIFRARKQPMGIHHDPTLGWGDLIDGDLELREIPGHYLNILIDPSVRILAKYLKDCLSKIQNAN